MVDGAAVGRVRVALGVQAGVTALGCALPGLGTTPRWAGTEAVLAALGAALVWYAGREPEPAAAAALVYEVLALAAGALALAAHHYVPGTVVAASVLGGLVRPPAAAAPAPVAAAPPERAPLTVGCDVLPGGDSGRRTW